jgi:hypothetical protein
MIPIATAVEQVVSLRLQIHKTVNSKAARTKTGPNSRHNASTPLKKDQIDGVIKRIATDFNLE